MDILNDMIKTSVDNISMEEELKKKLSNPEMLEKEREQLIQREEKQNKIVKFNTAVKKVATAAACLIMILAVTSVGTYAISGKSIFEVFFKGSEPEYAKELLDYNGQSYTVDEYTITLEQTLYDSKTYIGYCVFSITKEGGKPEAKINKFEQTPGSRYGKNGRFCIQNVGSQSSRFEYIGDVLYEYFSFRVDNEFDMIIRVMDLLDESEDGDVKYYEFNIAESNQYKEFKVNDTRSIFVSPLGISIHTIGGFRDVAITLYYKNGNKKTVVDTKNDIGIGLSSESSINYTEYLYQFVFKKMVDVKEIDYIMFNGERVEAVN